MSASDVVSTQDSDGAAGAREALLSRARDLRPLLWEDAASADSERRLTDRVADAITEAGMLSLTTPKRLGGYETDVLTALDVIAELGRGCMATSWVAAVIAFANYNVGLFTEQAQDDVWGSNPRARACWVLSPMVQAEVVDGGVVLGGKWPNASASAQSDWAVLGYPSSFGPQGPVFTLALVPLSDLTIEDTWYVAGVRGSASNTLVAEGVFVPEHRLLPFEQANRAESLGGHPEETLYRTSYSWGTSALLAPQLGVAQAMLELVMQKSQGKMVPAANVLDQSEDTAFQMEMAEAATKIDVAFLLARRDAAELDTSARTGVGLDWPTRGRIRHDGAWASRLLHDAGELLMDEAGVTAFGDSAPLQRMWRDLSTAHRHTGFRLNPTRELYGRVLLGKEPHLTFMV